MQRTREIENDRCEEQRVGRWREGGGEWDVSETKDKMMDGPSPPLAAPRARSEGVPTLTTMLTLMSKIWGATLPPLFRLSALSLSRPRCRAWLSFSLASPPPASPGIDCRSRSLKDQEEEGEANEEVGRFRPRTKTRRSIRLITRAILLSRFLAYIPLSVCLRALPYLDRRRSSPAWR